MLTTTQHRVSTEESPFSTDCPNLLQRHLDHLQASGLTREVIQERGYESVLGKKRLNELGFSRTQQRVPGLLIPLYPPDGSPPVYQYRPDHPRLNTNEKPIKYETPSKGRIRLDIPPRCVPLLGDPSVDLYITEGAKKADALASHGLCTVNLSGVWGFKGKNDLGGVTILADMDYLALNQRNVVIAYDSDVSTKSQVKQAMERLAEHLQRKGAIVSSVYLPQQGTEKVGVDDFLLIHSVEELQTLAEPIEVKGKQARAKVDYIALFDGLIDIVDHNGDLVYLVKSDEELKVVPSMVIEGQEYLPPPREQLPYLIPRWKSVEEAYKDDTQETLFQELIEHHKSYSELPNEGYYILLAAWDFSTYIPEALDYSGYIYLYAVPERGKTKTGQAMIYVAFRGIHQENLREADLFRASDDIGATLFLDIQNLSKKAKREGSEDILLQRFEKGARVRRVHNPERGRFKDSRWYSIYGATVIATNEPISNILESRSFPIDMPFSVKNFPKPTPEMGLPFRERLVAWRAHNVGIKLPEPKELIAGRLNDMAKPLWQIINLVSPTNLEPFEELTRELSEKRREERGASIEGEVLKALIELENKVENGKLAVSDITEKVNEDCRVSYKESTTYIGKVLRRLNFKPAGKHGKGRGYIYDPVLLKRLANEYGISDYMHSDYPSQASQVSQVSPQIEKIPIKGDRGDAWDTYLVGAYMANKEAIPRDVMEI